MKTYPAYFLVVSLLVSLVCGSKLLIAQEARPAEAPRDLTVDDLFRIKQVRDPQVSPDDDWVVYTVTTTNLEEDESETRVWMIPREGGEPIPMTREGVSSSRPRWSPNGRYLAFVSRRTDQKSEDRVDQKNQVWLLNRQGGEAQQLTKVIQGVRSYEWSPDGSQMVLVIQDPTPAEKKAAAKDEQNLDPEETRPPWVIDRLLFKRDRIGYLDRRRTHLYVVDVATREITQITSGDFDDSQPAWSPDGRFIAFVSNRTEEPDRNYNKDIWIVAVDNPNKGNTPRQVTRFPGEDSSPAWSPDSKWLVYTSNTLVRANAFSISNLATIPAEGGTPSLLIEHLDRNAFSPRFSVDGRFILFVLEDSGQRHLARIPAGGGQLSRIIDGPRSVREFSVGVSGELAALITEPHLPAEVFTLHGIDLRQLTHENANLLSEVRLAEVENVHFRSRDGTEIEGFIYKPPDFTPGNRYPTLLRIHGGPISQYELSFNFQAQLFAAHGYVVVMTNPRGSSGYGQDFSMAIFADWGNKDYEDVIAGVDYAIEQGYADPDRLGVGGWSYGGILTNYVITKTDRFKGAVSGASLGLNTANYGHDHYEKWYEQEFGLPWKNRELWERLSPYNDVDKIVTPTLWMGGEIDWNVPILNSEQMYIAMKRMGRETQLVVYPGQYHSIRKPSYQKDRLERHLAWYEKYVKGISGPQPTETSEKADEGIEKVGGGGKN